MRGQSGQSLVVVIGLFLVVGGENVRAAENLNWENVIALPPPRSADGNAFVRWTHASAAVPTLTHDELVLAGAATRTRRDEATWQKAKALCARWEESLAALELRPGEFVEFPRAAGPEGIVPEVEQLRALTRVQRLRAQLLWFEGRHADAVRLNADLIRMGAAACEGCNNLPSLLASLALISSGLDGAGTITRESNLDDDARRILVEALRAADGACVRGLANLVRGDHQLVFRVVVERLPQSHDVATVLNAVSSLGMPSGEATRETGRLGRVANKLLDVSTTLEMRGRQLADLITDLEKNGEAAARAFDVAERERVAQVRRELGAFAQFVITRDLEVAVLAEMSPVLEVLERVHNPVGKLLVTIMPVGLEKPAAIAFRHETRRRDILSMLEPRATATSAGGAAK